MGGPGSEEICLRQGAKDWGVKEGICGTGSDLGPGLKKWERDKGLEEPRGT